VARLFSQLEAVLRRICLFTNDSVSLAEVDTVSDQDLQAISSWNDPPFEGAQHLVHDLIAQTVQAMPDALAISAWDGELTYGQLDQLSTRLAQHLVHAGIGPEVIVPIYSEKSKWVPVCAVAIMKAGGAGVMIDCSQPSERVQSILEQTRASFVLVSRTNMERITHLEGLQLMVIEQASIAALPVPNDTFTLPQRVRPSNLAYISFTSGSTGKPKGAMISHANFASSIRNQQKALGFRAGQRVYDFASYAFDAAWSNLLHSLTSGSCLCIPSEEQRKNALSDSIRDSRATLLNATPSVLRHLDPKELPDIEQVLMGGEAWAETDFLEWIDRTKLINSYGPGECTIKSCLIQAYPGMVPNTIGFGIGVNTWIVRTDGSDRLAPLGSVGELWLEGPQVGRGYIGDEERTAASYVTRPRWTDSSGPPCRFYRTGDLVRYGKDGALIFVSRKDTQVKIRGQRTELGEVEQAIKRALLASELKVQVVADVFRPHKSDNPILVAFLQSEAEETEESTDNSWLQKLAGVDEGLATMVPEYMIPTAYIALGQFPMTATGKIHRRGLRETYQKQTLEQIVAQNALRVSGHRVPSTEQEVLLQQLWSEVLKVDPQTISAEDSFVRIGGDSLGAMLLVGAARKRNITLSVTDIFKLPKLCDLAAFISGLEPATRASPPSASVVPFGLLDAITGSADEARNQAASLCGLAPSDVEDVFPCTTLQAGLLAETVKRPGDNILTELWAFKEGIDPARFRAVWQQVVRANPILRTRIVDLPGQGPVQVVVCPERCGIEDGILAGDFGLGTPLVSYKISASGFLWSIHHALYDGWSMPLILGSIAKGYHDPSASIPQAPPFQAFVKYLQDVDQADVEKFWRDQFRDFNAQTFPVLPSQTYKLKCDQRLRREVSAISPDSDFTLATRVKFAWALLLATITNSTDASFGTTVSGRQVDVAGIEDMTGPTIATVPLRVAIDRSSTVGELLQRLQLQAADMMPFEQTGLQNIRRFSEDCDLGCQFQSLVVIQPRGRHDAEASLFDVDASPKADDVPFKHYAICLDIALSTDSISIGTNYDSNVVPVTQFHRLMDRFENILRQISMIDVQAKPAYMLDTTSSADLEQIWSWNQSCLHRSEQTIHTLFGEVAARQPDAPAVCSWDGDFTYGQVDDLSTRIAHRLLQAGLPQTGQRIVPLFFPKTRWMSVCQIAVMKANGTSVGIDVSLPEGRLRTIMDLVRPQVVLASAGQASRARELCPPATRVIVIGDSQELDKPCDEDRLPTVDPDTWLYVVFTSGSTGVPKGAIITHSNFASALRYGQTFLQFGPQSRTYDFVSYAFDVSWLNVLYTLCAGGCLCVPSQYEIQNEPAEAVGRRQANNAILTPTVGKLLHGTDLKLMNFGGEPLGRDEIDYWSQRATIIHSYGPSECTPIAISHFLDPARGRVIVGTGLGSRTWVVDPERGDSLAAVGDIGELWLEGPLVGQGYLNEPEKTAAAFVEDPVWLLRGGPGFAGRRGRLYRTGDLVRYEEDGNLEFIGRKDAQIKIRGQRIELEEIERHVLNAIGEGIASQVVVEIVKPADSSEPALLAFVKLATQEAIPAEELAASTRARLATVIPSYMVPNGYLIMDNIPTTTSGKVDRGQLRKAAMTMPKEQLLHVGRTAARRAPTTAEENKLHSVVARVLLLDPATFGMDENFILLGGDSISAMRLASVARQEGIFLTVADILSKNKIADLLGTPDTRQDEPTSDSFTSTGKLQLGFTGLHHDTDRNTFFDQVVTPQLQHNPGHGKLVALLPATHMQSVYLRDNFYAPKRSWLYSYIDFAHLPDEHVLVNNIERLVELCDIYRTAFVPYGNTFLQAVFDAWRPSIAIIDGHDDVEGTFDRIVEEDVKTPAVLGAPLVQFKLIRRPGAARLVFSMSHAVYDAISLGQTLSLLSEIHSRDSKLSTKTPANFSSFVTHIKTANVAASNAYWKGLLQHASMTSLPCTKLAPDTLPIILAHSTPLPQPPKGVTQATLFTYACAASLAHLTGSSDIVFGRVVSGRSSLPSSLSDVVGPCLNRIPVRVTFSPEQTKSQRLFALQKQSVESIPYESTGLDEIARHCGWNDDTDWGCWTQYQNVDERPELDMPGVEGRMETEEMLGKVPVGSDFLEIFAIPDDSGALTVKVIGGNGYEEADLARLLKGVCSELAE
jgi:amino acid adenylation domain-containing protein